MAKMPPTNQCIISGYLGQDPLLGFTFKSGKPYCFLNIAENYVVDGQHYVEWHRVVCWGDLAVAVADEFTAGDPIVVTGPYRSQILVNRETGEEKREWKLTALKVARPIYRKKKLKKREDQNKPTDKKPAEPLNSSFHRKILARMRMPYPQSEHEQLLVGWEAIADFFGVNKSTMVARRQELCDAGVVFYMSKARGKGGRAVRCACAFPSMLKAWITAKTAKGERF